MCNKHCITRNIKDYGIFRRNVRADLQRWNQER